MCQTSQAKALVPRVTCPGPAQACAAVSSCCVCSKTTQLKESHSGTAQLMALEGVGALAPLGYIVVLNRCFGNFYILNNDSWRQKSAVCLRASVKNCDHTKNILRVVTP